MNLAEILNVVGMTSSTLVTNAAEKEKILEMEKSFLTDDEACNIIADYQEANKIKLLDTINMDVAYLDDSDTAICFPQKDDKYIGSYLKLKYTSSDDSGIRTKFNYHFNKKDAETITKYAVDKKLPVFSKFIDLYEAITVNGKKFNFTHTYVCGKYIRFSYLEVEFDNKEDYDNFKFSDYFSFIEEDNVKDMSTDECFRMTNLYKLFGKN